MSMEDIDARDKFMFTLEWLLAVTSRYPENFRFCLVHIDYANPRILGEAYGAQWASQKLEEISRTLRLVFRKTDLIARDGCDFWVLLPYSPDTEKLVDKLKYVVEAASHGGLQIVERDISFFLLPVGSGQLKDIASAAEFLAHLKENHDSLALHEIALPAAD